MPPPPHISMCFDYRYLLSAFKNGKNQTFSPLSLGADNVPLRRKWHTVPLFPPPPSLSSTLEHAHTACKAPWKQVQPCGWLVHSGGLSLPLRVHWRSHQGGSQHMGQGHIARQVFQLPRTSLWGQEVHPYLPLRVLVKERPQHVSETTVMLRN